jgi:hypothetical protein
MAVPKIIYYISGHGYGHAVRSLEVINVLGRLGCRLWIKTAVPLFLLKERLTCEATIRNEVLDAGLHQVDNLRFDLTRTKGQVKKILETAPRWVEQESRFLIEEGFSGVVCDIPFIPFEAAERAGLPSIGIGNFSWDWVYAYYGERDPDWLPLAEAIASSYRKADLLLRLPFHGPMKAFPRVEDLPLVAKRPTRKKEEIRKTLRLPEDRKIILVGFSQVALTREALRNIENLSDRYLFIIRSPLDWDSPGFRKIEDAEASFIDLVAAADGVMTKPGYGIVADCLAAGTPMIYSDRGDFPEYPILVKGIEAYLPCCHMAMEEFFAGRWRPCLERLNEKPAPQKPPMGMNGAEVAGERILDWIEKRSGGGRSVRIL